MMRVTRSRNTKSRVAKEVTNQQSYEHFVRSFMRAIYLYDSLTNKSVSYMEENKLIDISRNQDYILQYDIDIKTLLFEN